MKASLTNFQKGLMDLSLYIEGLQLEQNLQFPSDLKKNAVEWEIKALKFFEHLTRTRASKKQFNYNSIIVSLYGLVERYIEDLLRSYIKFLGKIFPSYKALPDQIVNNHINGSFELLKKAEQNRYRGTYTKEDIIANLHLCVNDPDNFKLNVDAFTQHTANFRRGVINDLFTTAGLPNVCKLVLNHINFNSFLQEQGLDKLQSKINGTSFSNKKEDQQKSFEEKAFFFLNDLAERRNEVAHGVPSELLEHQLLLEYIKFFNIFGETLYKVIIHHLLQHEVEHCGFKIGRPSDVLKNGTVIIINIKDASIKTGDYIAGKNANEFILGDILELQVNDQSVSEIKPVQNLAVGIRISCKFGKTHLVSIIPRERKIIKYD
jgi:hypothetical protein